LEVEIGEDGGSGDKGWGDSGCGDIISGDRRSGVIISFIFSGGCRSADIAGMSTGDIISVLGGLDD
jgi:hypothetical protein